MKTLLFAVCFLLSNSATALDLGFDPYLFAKTSAGFEKSTFLPNHEPTLTGMLEIGFENNSGFAFHTTYVTTTNSEDTVGIYFIGVSYRFYKSLK